MFKALKRRWRNILNARRMARDIDPRSFLELSAELLDLVDAASKLWHNEPRFQERIRRLREEMEQLESLASKPEFKRLSPQKRLELRESLISSRDQLLESMHSAPSPTTTIQ
ncbi:putative nuclease with TOPRIM domain [Desulfobaculum xiamenense]|uniref:Putative nuclease with TOPRIM domain n=1 Tax=Desulfobaculum xiamenense TaxID=995050 RepID=A0A846QHA7_9BACT|nr:HAD-IG family 5'-nucleotidase [Desulfobaculum xiamenense]NJB67601.1 putative nuclease with TOPRIM domain [Desulfobaculum xiamenense]